MRESTRRGVETRRRSRERTDARCFRCGAPGARSLEIGDVPPVSSFNLCPACAEKVGAKPLDSMSTREAAEEREANLGRGTAWEPRDSCHAMRGTLPAHSSKEPKRKEQA